jgi:hypothetical protein
MTWLSFFVILIAGVFVLPLFFLWVPFFVEAFKDVVHHCPNCKAWIGTYRRIGWFKFERPNVMINPF